VTRNNGKSGQAKGQRVDFVDADGQASGDVAATHALGFQKVQNLGQKLRSFAFHGVRFMGSITVLRYLQHQAAICPL
jgi:hypothetical protein